MESEIARIQQAGGFVMNGRVNGQIAITRSLGDHIMKDFIIAGIPNPTLWLIFYRCIC
jgi:hypothetical protein